MPTFQQMQEHFSDGGSPALLSTRPIENDNVRIQFVDGTVSDWRITVDEDGDIVDVYCFNEVM
jgi:fibronectin type 3 domain-containing protein